MCDSALVRRAHVRIGALVGLAVTGLIAVVGLVSYFSLQRDQQQQITRTLAYETAYGAVSGPPGCTWLFVSDGRTVDQDSAAVPAGFPLRTALTDVAAGHRAESTVIERNGTTYRVLTAPRGPLTVQAVFDERFQLADRMHLVRALLMAAAIGLPAAVLIGLLAGAAAVAPLAQALERQRRFVADASHELRTPIAQVHTRAQILARRAHRTGAAADQRDVDRLVAGTGRLGEIVDELLLSARLAVVPARPVDLAALATDAVAQEADRAGERRITVTLAVPGEPVPVPGVESALRRVAGELLANALTHTSPGGRITVSVRRTDRSRAEIEVADDGDGFDPADRALIFDRFHRGAGATDRQFGLGLALLREIVLSHHGSIEAAGHPGRGATFTVRLPAVATARRAGSGAPAPSGG